MEHLLVVVLLIARVICHPDPILEKPLNEILKEDEEDRTENPLSQIIDKLPKFPPSELEAFYYGTYGEIDASTMGRRERPGNSTTSATCSHIRSVPHSLRNKHTMRPKGISATSTKYTEAYGVPVLGSSLVSDDALRRACYVLRFLLSDRGDLREAYYKSYGRVVVMAPREHITDIEEYYFLSAIYDDVIRGLGAIPVAPVTSAGEENILCYSNDTYRREDILIREMALGIFHLAAKQVIPGYAERLRTAYETAIASQWWINTYAALSKDSYLGEGVQSYFNVNSYSNVPDGVRNTVNTRAKLRSYDPSLYYLVQELFPCGNHYLKRCRSRRHENYQILDVSCHNQRKRST